MLIKIIKQKKFNFQIFLFLFSNGYILDNNIFFVIEITFEN